jgi:uncharacterized delta-60 repeat protein
MEMMSFIGGAALMAGAALGAADSVPHAGDLDPSFGSGAAGYLTYDFNGGDDIVYSIVPLPDGRLIAAGTIKSPNTASAGSSANFGIARLLPSGALDTTFGTAASGWETFDFDASSGPDEIRAGKRVTGGRIVFAGTISRNSHRDFFLMRMLPGGGLDTAFGHPGGTTRLGWTWLDVGAVFASGISAIHDDGRALAVQSDGKIVVAGVTSELVGGVAYNRAAVARFTADGDLDTTFGGQGNGVFLLPPTSGSAQSNDVVYHIALQQDDSLPGDDSITLVGETLGRSNAFAARLTRDGTLDTTFGNINGAARTGVYTVTSGSSGGVATGLYRIFDARYSADGKLIVTGDGADRGITLMRLTHDGTLDPTFASNGRVTFKLSGGAAFDQPAAMALQGAGKIVVAGYTAGATGTDMFVIRALPSGAVDTSFGDGAGRRTAAISSKADEAFAIAVEPSGNLLVGGYQQDPGAANQQLDYALLRLTGEPDRIFFDDFQVHFQ